MRTLTLSGWGHAPDTLRLISPDAECLDYTSFRDTDEVFEQMAKRARSVDRIIAWSLGGQLAVRAIAAKIIRPRLLTLIATPYQFVETADLPLGMDRSQFAEFRERYIRDPQKTLKKAWNLVAWNDARARAVRQAMRSQDFNRVAEVDWLPWLDVLGAFSCEEIDFSGFPNTLLVHGKNDAVVHYLHSLRFADRIENATLLVWNQCGHAPHWYDGVKLQRWIMAHFEPKPTGDAHSR
ncbi:MAG: alpha/beta hydrolase [Pirellulales bacterium]|nr:alpha/beta hydrolase [Pirellulales bacterium]